MSRLWLALLASILVAGLLEPARAQQVRVPCGPLDTADSEAVIDTQTALMRAATRAGQAQRLWVFSSLRAQDDILRRPQLPRGLERSTVRIGQDFRAQADARMFDQAMQAARSVAAGGGTPQAKLATLRARLAGVVPPGRLAALSSFVLVLALQEKAQSELSQAMDEFNGWRCFLNLDIAIDQNFGRSFDVRGFLRDRHDDVLNHQEPFNSPPTAFHGDPDGMLDLSQVIDFVQQHRDRDNSMVPGVEALDQMMRDIDLQSRALDAQFNTNALEVAFNNAPAAVGRACAVAPMGLRSSVAAMDAAIADLRALPPPRGRQYSNAELARIQADAIVWAVSEGDGFAVWQPCVHPFEAVVRDPGSPFRRAIQQQSSNHHTAARTALGAAVRDALDAEAVP